MKKIIKRFDMERAPIRTRWYLRPVTWLLSFPAVVKHKTKITYTGTEGLKPPYVLLCNHNAFFDFMVATRAIFPHRANYVVAIDGFLINEWLLRNVGAICKRKFTSDINLIKQLRRVINNGDVAIIYPEARYSLCGTNAVLPDSLGKLCKLLKVPVVTLICHGHHVNSPFWHVGDRGVKQTEAELKLQFTPEELKEASPEQINARLAEAFHYDDFAWQKNRSININYKKRAEGLEHVLYQCPACSTEYEMQTKGADISCAHCGKSWHMTPLGELKAEDGKTEFSHIPDWYEWERENVRKEVQAGTYDTGRLPVTVESLPNAKGFIKMGEGTLQHNGKGFVVTGVDKDGDSFAMEKSVSSLYSCHIEYNYKKKGDCVSLSTLEDTLYIYPHDAQFSVTKMSLATEELYVAYRHEAEEKKSLKNKEINHGSGITG